MARKIHIFISHSWQHSGEYKVLVNTLDQAPNFSYYNQSIPQDKPVTTASSNAELSRVIKKRMSKAQIVLILASLDTENSKWVRKEIHIAQAEFEPMMPILVIKPKSGASITEQMRNSATEILKWDSDGIVDAIEEYAL